MPISIRDLKNTKSLVDVIGDFVELKQRGDTWKGICPFHAEKTPSFIVSPKRNQWRCWGCGKHGDIFSFLMEFKNWSFMEAVKFLAAGQTIAPRDGDRPLTTAEKEWVEGATNVAKQWRKCLNVQAEKNACVSEHTEASRNRWKKLKAFQRTEIGRLRTLLDKFDTMYGLIIPPFVHNMPLVHSTLASDVEPFVMGSPNYRDQIISLLEKY